MLTKKLSARELILALSGFTAVAFLMLLVRIRWTGELRYTFLVWNLFLAYVPVVISITVKTKRQSLLTKLFVIVLWLLFFPNAPYIVTDFIHLQSYFSWYDAALIGIFALLGLIAGYYLLALLERKFTLLHWGKYKITGTLFFLTALGVYLGRVLRWNSWDVIHRPLEILEDVMNLFFHPVDYFGEWMAILSGAFFLLLGYRLFKQCMHLIYEEAEII